MPDAPQAPAAPTAPADATGRFGLPASVSSRLPMHVGGLVLAALVVVIALHLGGFRFVFDASVGRGR